MNQKTCQHSQASLHKQRGEQFRLEVTPGPKHVSCSKMFDCGSRTCTLSPTHGDFPTTHDDPAVHVFFRFQDLRLQKPSKSFQSENSLGRLLAITRASSWITSRAQVSQECFLVPFLAWYFSVMQKA